MKTVILNRATEWSRASRKKGFTLVEIALCLGIVAFALVAIMGVLPMGLKVQQENREETIINQEALYLLEAIRSGSRGLHDLTNHIERINVRRRTTRNYAPRGSERPGDIVVDAEQLVALMSIPKLEALNGQVQTNSVVAQVRAISGVAGGKSERLKEFAFRYQVEIEIVPYMQRGPAANEDELREHFSMRHNLHEIRLNIRWPVYQRGDQWVAGSNRRVYRALASGRHEPVQVGQVQGFFFTPGAFASGF
jgi:type II secretory pathway pseudopilin PulG